MTAPAKASTKVQRLARLVPHAAPPGATVTQAPPVPGSVPAAQGAPGQIERNDQSVHGTAGAVTLDKKRPNRAEKLRNIVFVSSEASSRGHRDELLHGCCARVCAIGTRGAPCAFADLDTSLTRVPPVSGIYARRARPGPRR